MQARLDDCIAKMTRLTRMNREYETSSKIFKADNKQLRNEISDVLETNKRLEADKEDLTNQLNAADIKVQSISMENEEIVKNDQRNTERIVYLEQKLREATEEIQETTSELEKAEADKVVLNFNLAEVQRLLEVKTNDAEDFAEKLATAKKRETELVKEVSDYSSWLKEARAELKNKTEELNQNLSSSETQLGETQKMLKALKKKFENEVTQAAQISMSAAEDRNELSKQVTELTAENKDLRQALTDSQRDFQRFKIDSTMELQQVTRQYMQQIQNLDSTVDEQKRDIATMSETALQHREL